MGKKKLLSFALFPLLLKTAYAHCPLCTIGAAAAAGTASYFGLNKAIIGIFIGAFAVSIGWYSSKLIKRKFIPLQKSAIILFSFFATVIPLMPMVESQYPLGIFLFGEYGTLLNRTYLINLFLLGSIFGGIITSLTPWLSEKITHLRHGKFVPFQGILLTFLLLIISSLIAEVII
ncbi:hypothetical protein J4458_00575 [Candidatus Woesearchaeota archaeon]|nr:hypothetical protein [Candidatus Woesearchaeota archaeon]